MADGTGVEDRRGERGQQQADIRGLWGLFGADGKFILAGRIKWGRVKAITGSGLKPGEFSLCLYPVTAPLSRDTSVTRRLGAPDVRMCVRSLGSLCRVQADHTTYSSLFPQT